MLADLRTSDPLTDSVRLRRALFGVLLVACVLPKIAFFLYRGEMWADEICLARNIGPRALFDMGRPFLYLQVAPWGAMVAIKAVVTVFGESMYTYRLVPLICSFIVIVTVYYLAKRLAGPTAGLVAMALAGLTSDLNYYATEMKPYSSDAAVAAVLALLAVRFFDNPDDRRAKLTLLAAGAIAGWVSLPSLFVTGGCGLAWALHTWLRTKDPKAVARLLGVAAVWVGSFVIHYQIFIAGSATTTNKNVAKFWAAGFAPFPPTTLAEFKWYPAKFLYFFERPGALSSRYLAGLIFAVGVVWLVRRGKKAHVLALVVPFLLAILASAIGKYSSVGRLVLFALPSMVAVLAVGVVALAHLAKKAASPVAVAVVLVLVAPRIGQTYAKVLDPVAPTELQHIMAEMKPTWRPGDPVYMAGAGLATLWDYHSPGTGMPNEYFGVEDLRNFDAQGNYPQLRVLADKTFGMKRLWFIAESRRFDGDPKLLGRTTEPYAPFVARFFDRWGGKGRLVFQASELAVYFYDLSEAQLPEGPEAIQNPEPN